MAEPNSVVIWRGPSLLDGGPIVVIATGLTKDSTNTKTGAMIQTYILRDDEIAPPAAITEGKDRSIRGDCKLRGDGTGLGRSCYVQVKWAPLGLWKVRNSIPDLSDGLMTTITDLFVGRQVRFGSYGDPAAAPYGLWKLIQLAPVEGWTGYTHQWKHCDPRFREFLMASVDTRDELAVARFLGWRTFRTRADSFFPPAENEIICPASAEAGHLTTCAQCNLCRGRATTAKDIVIVAHGNRTAKYGIPLLPFEDQTDDRSTEN